MISVIIITKNRINLLKRAIKSVLLQTYKNIEIIVVDDNSTDGTEKYLINLIKQYDFIKYHKIPSNKSTGSNHARNVGIKLSNGEFIAFLDDDDEWMNNKLEILYNAFKTSKNTNLGMVYSSTLKINTFFNNKLILKKILKHNIIVNLDQKNKILYDNFIGGTSNPLIKKDILIKCGCFDELLCMMQDFELWIRICQISDTLYIDMPLTKYYSENNSRKQITNNISKFIEARNYINKKHSSLFNKLDKEKLKMLNNNDYKLICQRSLLLNDKKNYRKYITKQKNNIKNIFKYILSYININSILKLTIIKTIFKARNI